MADLKRWPMALNQPGYEYPAELFRAEHHDATSGGNGVGAPTALKVTAQTAPDGTVSILPGGATVKSTYAGADGQSYHARNFQPFTLDVPPTGSSAGGRTDLIILRVCDPQYDVHPAHGGGEISAEDAAGLDFWWFEILTGRDRSASLPYPHVKLAEIKRPANLTVVTNSHIADVRVLANPQTDSVLLAYNIGSETHTAGRTGNYNTLASFYFDVPDWATQATVDAVLAGAYVRHPNGPAVGNVDFSGLGTVAGGQQTGWGVEGSVSYERIDVHAGGEVDIPEEIRGTTARVNLRVRIPTTAPVGTEFGTERQSLGKLLVIFKQGVL